MINAQFALDGDGNVLIQTADGRWKVVWHPSAPGNEGFVFDEVSPRAPLVALHLVPMTT